MKVVLLLALLCLRAGAAAWTDGAGFRHRELPAPAAGTRPGFRMLPAAATGLAFTNLLSDPAIARNRILANGSGVAFGDFDDDGHPDLFVCGLESPSRLYRNLGDFRFADATAAAGLPPDLKYARGAVFADLDGDGRPDLLVSTMSEGVRCFLNSGGHFSDGTAQSGLLRHSGSTTLALADIDGNGSLDLYVANYRTNDIRDVGRVSVRNVGGKPFIPPELRSRFLMRRNEIAEYGEADQLYLNDGRGRFSAVPWTNGIFLDVEGRSLAQPPLDWGLTASFRDVNGDGTPDLYVCNDFWTPDRFWLNDGKGHLRAAPPFTLRKIPSSSMGVDFADIDRDGRLDFFAVEMLATEPRNRKRQALADKPEWPAIGLNADLPQVFQNTLYTARGDGTFAEIAWLAGLAATDWSWSPLFVDVDLDGFEDLLISTGHFRDVQDLDAQAEIRRRQHSWAGFTNEPARQAAYTKELAQHYQFYPLLQLPMRAYRNGGDRRFQDTTATWGFTNAAVHHGMALADLDGDGDLDLVVNCLNGALEVYRNEAPGPRVAIRLRGIPPNTDGIGARIELRDSTGVQQKELVAGGTYLSGSEPLAMFGIRSEGVLEVHWRSGRVSRVPGIVSNRLYEISEPKQPTSPPIASPTPRPLFVDASSRLNHTHTENAYDDYQRQPLLPFKRSQQGPSLAWFDLDGDGIEDLIVGTGAGGAPSVFYSDGRGGFTLGKSAPELTATGDHLGLVGFRDPTRGPRLIAAVSGYEIPQKTPVYLAASSNRALARLEAANLPANYSSASTLALGCLTPPAGMALFVAGGVDPGRYPFARPSALLVQDASGWKYDARKSASLANLGLVNGVVWSDLDGDGFPELILACEWGPIRVFANRNATLVEITPELGLSELTGLWNGIASADLDGDGRMDLVVGNWGLNSPWSSAPNRPFTAFIGEMSQPGIADFIETEWDGTTGALTPIRSLERLSMAMPFVAEQFASLKVYGEARALDVLGERKVLARPWSVRTLESTVFLNRGGKFTPMPLPLEAQFAPAFSVQVADFDGDGHPDVFLSQNLMALHPDYARQDAGQGLLLKGDGNGRFRSMGAIESGIRIEGEQRAGAVCDFDRDGRPDLAVSQNGAATRLFWNREAKPGLRVQVSGPPGNPDAIGAQVWVESGNHRTPVQEIQAGSGWLAQDSPIKIVPRLPGGTVKVRWPGGKVTSAPIPEAGPEIRVAAGNAEP